MKSIVMAVIVSGFLSGCGKSDPKSVTEYQTHGVYGEKPQFVAEGQAPAPQPEPEPAAEPEKPADEQAEEKTEQEADKPTEEQAAEPAQDDDKPDCVEIRGKKYCAVQDEQ